MNFVFGMLGIIASIYMIVYREVLGNTIGDAEWMHHVGGIYYVIVYIAIGVFFYSIAIMFDLTEAGIFSPLIRIFMPYAFKDGEAPI